MRKALRKQPPVTQTNPAIKEEFSHFSLSQSTPFPALSKIPGCYMQLCLESVNDDVHCRDASRETPCALLRSSNLTLLSGTLQSCWFSSVVLQSAGTAELKDACYFLSRLNQTRRQKSASSLTGTKRPPALAATRPTWHLSPR